MKPGYHRSMATYFTVDKSVAGGDNQPWVDLHVLEAGRRAPVDEDVIEIPFAARVGRIGIEGVLVEGFVSKPGMSDLQPMLLAEV